MTGMRAAVADAPNEPLTFVEREVPEPGLNEVLVKVTACGVCYTDLDVLQGHWPIANFPLATSSARCRRPSTRSPRLR
jgi:propanol-preferring alcohol dehydrogenase